MSLEYLKSNVQQEKELVKRLQSLVNNVESVQDSKERDNLMRAIESTKNQIRILNAGTPDLVKGVSLARKISPETPNKKIISVSHQIGGSTKRVAIQDKDKSKYLKELNITEESLKGLKKKDKKEEDDSRIFKKPNSYIRISNNVFSNISSELIKGGYFRRLNRDLRKANFMILLRSYVSMMFFTTLISAIVGFFIMLFFLFFSLTLSPPFIYLTNANFFTRLLQVFWIVPVVPLLTILVIYFYPSTERSTIKHEINYELPFAAIQMSAIAGAELEPSNIFKIIAMSKEYPQIRKEAKKLMNQINLYGYDLISALRNVAEASPSEKWADLLSGMSTIIKTGGDLSKYLDKKAETLLFNYRLDREKATKSAETFMDIYIAVVIAAPMLMMLLLVLMSVFPIGFNIPLPILTIIMISAVSLINVVFLVFLHLNQRKL